MKGHNLQCKLDFQTVRDEPGEIDFHADDLPVLSGHVQGRHTGGRSHNQLLFR